MALAANFDDRSWASRAACAGEMGEAFYPPLEPERKAVREAREAAAKRICATCPVTGDCLDHALRVDERYGIWGGLNHLERRALTN